MGTKNIITGLKRTGIPALLLFCSPVFCFADLGTIHLKDGKSFTVEIIAADRGQVQWKADKNPTSPVQISLQSTVDYVDFPPSDQWTEAENAFESGRLNDAVALYSKVAADKLTTYYPMPGNFSSLAQVRILGCYRISLNQAAIVKQAAVVRGEFLNLPPEYRKFDPVIECWIAMSKKKWEDALTAIKKEKPPGPEGFLLRGLVLESLGKKDEAVQAYAGAYVMNFGGPVEIAKLALQKSAGILAASGDENRKSEIQAQAKIYRDLFGKGKLWAGAPEWLSKLAAGKIDTLGKADAPAMEKPDSAGGPNVVVSEKAEKVTLPPVKDRYWLLTSELKHKIYLKGVNPNANNLKIAGGVKVTPEAYVFDGTGGGVRLSGINTSQPFLAMNLVFVADSADGVLFDLNNKDGKKGGFGLYLQGGQLHATWAKAGIAPVSWKIGTIKPGQRYNLYLKATRGDVIGFGLNTEELTKQKKPPAGLSIGEGLTACIGDTAASDTDKASADGKTHTPFKGKILHFSIGTGPAPRAVVNQEKKQFGGKIIRMIPPSK